MFSGSNKLKKNPKALKSSKKELGTSLKEVKWPVFGGLPEGGKITERKGNCKCKINVLVSKKIVLPLLKKPASLTTFHFKIPLVKICPPTRKAKNQDDISLMTSCSPHYDICVYYI